MEHYPIWKHATRLADGREILYYDEAPGLRREAVRDERPVPGFAAATTSQLRWDALNGEWVIIAQQRQDRTFLPPADACPLCPSAPGRPTEIPASSYDVVVFENRFPALSGAGPAGGSGRREPGGGGLLAATASHPSAPRPGVGRCEVVCFTADHGACFAGLTPSRVRTVVEAWADRTCALAGLTGIEQVFCFENRGEEIGVTLHHPHGQIYGYPFVTPRTSRMLEQARLHAERTGRNLFDDLVAGELAAGERVVARNDHWAVFVPAAARWPFEILFFPAERVPDLSQLGEAARDGFCGLYLDVLRRLDTLFGSPAPYISAWHQAPVTAGGAIRAEFALHLQVLSVRRAPGKLKYLAGSESGMGVWINDIVPETAAQRLREVM